MITMIKRYFLSEAVQMPKPNDKKDITVDDITDIAHRHDKQNAINYANKTLHDCIARIHGHFPAGDSNDIRYVDMGEGTISLPDKVTEQNIINTSSNAFKLRIPIVWARDYPIDDFYNPYLKWTGTNEDGDIVGYEFQLNTILHDPTDDTMDHIVDIGCMFGTEDDFNLLIECISKLTEKNNYNTFGVFEGVSFFMTWYPTRGSLSYDPIDKVNASIYSTRSTSETYSFENCVVPIDLVFLYESAVASSVSTTVKNNSLHQLLYVLSHMDNFDLSKPIKLLYLDCDAIVNNLSVDDISDYIKCVANELKTFGMSANGISFCLKRASRNVSFKLCEKFIQTLDDLNLQQLFNARGSTDFFIELPANVMQPYINKCCTDPNYNIKLFDLQEKDCQTISDGMYKDALFVYYPVTDSYKIRKPSEYDPFRGL